MYKVVMKFPNGTTEADDEVFESESEARDYGLILLSANEEGLETLHMSNPGDNPLPDDDDGDAEFEVLEV